MALGGEAPSTADIRAVWAASPGLRVVNRYGPTETTIAVAILTDAELLDAGLYRSVILIPGAIPPC